jgi:alpha-1,2-mannosyltransferase
MNQVYDVLRSGAWLTRERVGLVAVAILSVSGVALVYLAATAHGLVDTQGRPLGTDFSSFYAAGTHVLDGHPDAPYDLARQHARQQAIFGPATPFYGWLYPPFFLFIAAALARLPYAAALAVWQAVTLGLYLLAIRAILTSSLRGAPTAPARSGRPDDRFRASSESITPESEELARKTGLWRRLWIPDSRSAASGMRHDWLLLALAFPAVLINLGHGQNGFLTAALLGGALAVLDRRPIVAGLLLGLLAYKPQFGLMIPLVLTAGGHWRSFATAAITVVLLAFVTTLTFGTDVWHAFLESSRFARLVVLEQGDPGFYKMQSVFAWARMWGAPIPVAYALQAALAAGLAVALLWLWRSAAPYPLKAAALCLGAILATPFTFDYDMMLLAPAIAFCAADGLARGFGPWEKTALAGLWLMPLFARSVAQITLIPIGVPVMLAVFILLLRRSTSHFASPIAFSGTFLLK